MTHLNRAVIVNFSGGKDSTVAIIQALKKFPKEDIILCWQNTGAEYLETEKQVKSVAEMLELPLVILSGKRDFWEEVRYRGYFPSPNCRNCTSRLKIEPFNKWFRANKSNWNEVVVIFGKRGEESLVRRNLEEWSVNTILSTRALKVQVWNPCLHLKEQEVFDIIEAEGLPLHPCYEFSKRCSCWACFFQPSRVVRVYAEMHPDLYEKACIIEDEIHHKWKFGFGFNDLLSQLRLF